ncbi:MAG: RNA-binding S4 domain-containing protein [Alphaproteobacteria bacterium]|nr:RNA-binding S4 domain-containing protein [Alphaproteobacteria bacterium]
MSGERVRLDVWLWRARFFKTRTMAAGVVEKGVFVERTGQSRKVDKPATTVEPGDGISFRQGRVLRTVRVSDLGTRRGPAADARLLYDDLEPPVSGEDAADGAAY